MSGKAVLVLGDVMLDVREEGEMTRISPEAPAPIVRQRSQIMQCGGAANVAANLAALGNSVFLASFVGNDAPGKKLTEFSNAAGVATLLLPLAAQTIVKTRITCGGQQILRLDSEPEQLLPQSADLTYFEQQIAELVNAGNLGAIVIADYDKGSLPLGVVARLLAAAKDKVPVFVDTKPDRVTFYPGATIKMNLPEAREVYNRLGSIHPAQFGKDALDFAQIAAKAIAMRITVEAVIVTCGEHGASYYSSNMRSSMSATPQHVADPTGAGDTFMAAFVSSLLRGLDAADALEQAVVAGQLAVAEYGIYVVTSLALDMALRSRSWGDKVVAEADLETWSHLRRHAGKTIVLANGCFDLFHPGHAVLLEYAKAQGDELIVACNDDASITALKGTGRPLLPLSQRLASVATHACVDAVFEFDGDVEKLVRRLHPDVLVKGEEYRATKVPGADYVAVHGGRVEFAPLHDGYSTSKLIERIQQVGR